jgi:hypothetical protein
MKEHERNVKEAVFWDVVPCESCENRCFGGTCHLCLQGRKNTRARNAMDFSSQTKLQFGRALNENIGKRRVGGGIVSLDISVAIAKGYF